MKALVVGLLALLAAVGGLVAGAPAIAERALAGEGVTATAAWCDAGLCLRGVARGEARAARVTVAWDRSVRAEGVTVPLAAALDLARAGAAEGGGGARAGGASAWVRRLVTTVDVADLSVPGAPLPVLSGRVWPDRALAGENVRIEGETVRAAVATPLGAMTLEASRGADGLALVATCPACVLPAPGPSDEPLALPAATARGAWRDGAFDGVLRLSAVEAQIVARPDGDGIVADVTIPETRIADVYALFLAWVPEARRARIDGTLAATARLRLASDRLAGMAGLAGVAPSAAAPTGAGASAEAGEDGAGSGLPFTVEAFSPTLADFAVDGVVPDTLHGGPFQFRGRDAKEEPVVFTRGEGTPEWAPLSELGAWLPAAVIAAEDGAFLGHAGYSLEGMQEAYAHNAEKGAIRRGGSTLTQQLAKNLFLDGTRSYARKLRELLYAVELERELGKTRILELYLNVVEFAPGVRGAKAAADLYFFKAPAGLLPEEAAWLADILRYPSTAFQRQYLAGKVDQGRVRWILANMQGVPEDARDAALARPVRLVPPARAP